MNTQNRINWKTFFILFGACLFGLFAVLPYTLDLQKDLLAQVPVPLPVLLTAQTIQGGVLFAIAILIGLLLMGRCGFSLPVITGWLSGEPVWEKIKSFLPLSILIGMSGSMLIVLLDRFVFGPALSAQIGEAASKLNLQGAQPAAWKGLLASFYGGINEEVLLRFFLMTVLVWLGRFLHKSPDGLPSAPVVWTANILAAVLFGLGHLPATAVLVPLTPLVILRAVVLNGLLGVALGWLYWKRGLESAILSHFTADLVLHVILAL